jgi:hypothetical protein
MAKTSGAKGFVFKRNLKGTEHPGVEPFRVASSQTITVGDVVRINTSGLVVLVELGNAVLGVVRGIYDSNYKCMTSLGYSNNTGATITGDDTVTTASDNGSKTGEYVMVEVELDPAGENLYYNDADDDLAQTNVGQFFDILAASDQIDASSASDTSGQMQLIMIDPDADADASKGLFRVSEPQLMCQVANATAVNAA